MDRLSPIARLGVWIALLGPLGFHAASCDDGQAPLARPVSRVATAQTPVDRTGPEQWCDRYFPPRQGPPVALLPLAGRGAEHRVVGSATRWTWLNLWATWCAPCLREMPLILRWIRLFEREGHPIDLAFLSLDEDPGQLARFLSTHPQIAAQGTLQLAQGARIQPWLTGLGVAPETPIPIQFFVAPGKALRCVRYGAMSDSDFQQVRRLLEQKRLPPTGGTNSKASRALPANHRDDCVCEPDAQADPADEMCVPPGP